MIFNWTRGKYFTVYHTPIKNRGRTQNLTHKYFVHENRAAEKSASGPAPAVKRFYVPQKLITSQFTGPSISAHP